MMETRDLPGSGLAEPSGQSLHASSLVLAWSHDPSAPLGYALTLAEGRRPLVWVFGRGAPSNSDAQGRLLLTKRPGHGEPGLPLEDPFLSRCQLVVRSERGGLRIRNVGKRGLLVNGERIEEAVVRPGALVEIERLLLFVYVRRSITSFARRTGATPFGRPDDHGIVGESAAVEAVRDQIDFVGRRREHVLVLGPTGSGKELVARAIHAASSRGKRRLVTRNAATIPASLADAELFGNAVNYPNAGMAERPGLVGESEGSTLFLDEIAELPDCVQAKLLRIMDDGDYQRLGDVRRRTANVRIIGATNRSLEHLRADVNARFPLRVRLPSLVERREDIPLLARHVAERIFHSDPSTGDRPPTLGRRLVASFLRYPFHGNVRELHSLLMTALATREGSEGDPFDLTPEVQSELAAGQQGSTVESARAAVSAAPLPTAEQIREALDRCGGVRERAWRDLGLGSRYVLKRLMQRYGLMNLTTPMTTDRP